MINPTVRTELVEVPRANKAFDRLSPNGFDS